MNQILDVLKKKVFQVDGLTVTVGAIIVVLVVAWFVFGKK